MFFFTKIKIIINLFISLFFVLVVSCANNGLEMQKDDGNISPFSQQISSNKDSFDLDIKRSTDVKEAYPFAKTRAKEWNPESYLVGIMPSKLMGVNLGRMPSKPGWFFKFKASGTISELYVQVVGHDIGGQQIAAPILLEPLPYSELQIDMNEINLEEKDVLLIYYEKNEEKDNFQNGNGYLDFRLIHLRGDPNPVWSLFIDSVNGFPLINIDAVTGEQISDPFEKYY